MNPSPPQAQEDTQAIALPGALLSEEVEPSAVAVASDGTHIYLRGFVAQVSETQFIANRSWKLGAGEAARRGGFGETRKRRWAWDSQGRANHRYPMIASRLPHVPTARTRPTIAYFWTPGV